ncbi:39S ribosomal protein L43, mitochondrial [Camponotus floridanus]|uniref:Large ribosomal subunit protein mL43 n=1 Tax=Camponotus floridanus TaxID=104421 RepID=E2AD22_CAMFO|nr:39S ribosomal protein L43, mitochondrial [Camponotus floridanus]
MSNKQLFLPSGFPRAPLGLGIGRYVCQLQRVTLKFCKNHGTSRGMRDFIEHNLVQYAKDNPGVVVYAKPRRHKHPVIVAEYLNGGKHWMDVANYSRDDITKWMELVRTQIHNSSAMRLPTEKLVELFKAQQLNDSEKKDDSEAVQEDSEHVQRA